MPTALQERTFHILQSFWHTLFHSYRNPLLLTTCTGLTITSLVWRRLAYEPELLPRPPEGYQYDVNLVRDSSFTFAVPGGRKLGYAEYGDSNGKPIIVLHGILGSRLEVALFDANAREFGARIIGIERPGIGLSTPDPRPPSERRVLDHAKDVEALVEHLQLKEYAVIGMSGGGPYALACGSALPSSASKPKLRAVSIVTGLGLPDMSQPYPPFVVWLNRHLNLRWLLRFLFTSGPAWQLHLSDEQRMEGMRKSFDVKKAHPADVEVARNPNHPDMVRIFLRSSREAIAQGYDGFLDDAAILSADPGFRIEDIRTDLPVQLWYGTDDTNVSPKAGEQTAQRLRTVGNMKVELHMERGETHGSTQNKYQRQILEDLLEAMDS